MSTNSIQELSEIAPTNLVKYEKTKSDSKWQYYKYKWDKNDPLNTKSKCHVIYEQFSCPADAKNGRCVLTLLHAGAMRF